jgi:hypothetical protein
MATYLEDRSFRHFFDIYIDGFGLYTVISFVHGLASVLYCFLLWTKPSRDIIDIGDLGVRSRQMGETYGSTESNDPYAGVGSFHSRYHYLEGSSSIVSEEMYLE